MAPTPDDQIREELSTAMEMLAESEMRLKATQERLAAANQSILDLEKLLAVTQRNLSKAYDALNHKP